MTVGASPRGSLALLELARARAALHGRDFVLPDDVKAVAVPALAHRLILRPELWVQRVSAKDMVGSSSRVPTPQAEDTARAEMTRPAGPRLEGYASLAATGLVAVLALRRPKVANLAAPFALVLAVGLRPHARPSVTLARPRGPGAGHR